MKAKEFNFLTLNTKTDWHKGYSENLQTSDEGLQLKYGSRFVAENTLSITNLPSQLDVVDFAVGDFAQLYLLDKNNRCIWLFNLQQKRLEQLDFLKDFFSSPTNIAFSRATIYVADVQPIGETYQTRIYAFIQSNWQIKWVVTLPVGVKVIDLAADAKDGTLYALLDVGEKIVVKYAASGEEIYATGFNRAGIERPTAIALGSLGSVYILDSYSNEEQVVKFATDSSLYSIVISFARLRELGKIPLDMKPSALMIDSEENDNIYVGDNRIIPRGEEDSRFILQFSPSQQHTQLPQIQLIPDYRGLVTKLVLDSKSGRLFVLNGVARFVKVFKKQKQFLPCHQNTLESKALPTGFFLTVFDSTTPGQRWHKFVLDREIPSNTQIQISYYITDQEGLTSATAEWSKAIINPQDALIISNDKGRYLHVRIEFIGTPTKTPLLNSIRAYFPRLSYLRYLPAVYQEDEISRDFLERFLSLFETFFTNIEGEIDDIGRYFDADVVDVEFLRWLSTWLDVVVDDNWTEQQLRDIVRNAPQLYKLRGTRQGIAATIELLTGERPLIVENFLEDNPFRFSVLLHPYQIETEMQQQTLQRLIEADKPAYTEARVKVLQPWIYLDRETYLEFNSYIFEPSLHLDMGAAISQEMILTDTEKAGAIERQSRLEVDTLLT